jgi:hypothetical protein
MHNKWGVKVTGSDEKTNYETNVGRNWKPSTLPGHDYKEVK